MSAPSERTGLTSGPGSGRRPDYGLQPTAHYDGAENAFPNLLQQPAFDSGHGFDSNDLPPGLRFEDHESDYAYDESSVEPNHEVPNWSYSPRHVNAHDVESSGSKVGTHFLLGFYGLVVALDLAQSWTDKLHDTRDRYVLATTAIFLILSTFYVLVRLEHKRMQQRGYIDFYIHANGLLRFIFFAAAYGTVAVAIVYVYSRERETTIGIETNLLLRILVSAHMVMQLFGIVAYVKTCAQHNAKKPVPDAHNIDDLPSVLSTPALRQSPQQSNHRTMLKKQANVIQFLKDKIKSLSQELVRIRNNSDNLFHSSGPDLNHALAEKDKELRHLRVENDTLRQQMASTTQRLSELKEVSEYVHQENEEHRRQLDTQKETIGQQAQEISRLMVLLDVQKDANIKSRKTINTLSRSFENRMSPP